VRAPAEHPTITLEMAGTRTAPPWVRGVTNQRPSAQTHHHTGGLPRPHPPALNVAAHKHATLGPRAADFGLGNVPVYGNVMASTDRGGRTYSQGGAAWPRGTSSMMVNLCVATPLCPGLICCWPFGPWSIGCSLADAYRQPTTTNRLVAALDARSIKDLPL
jgi:hypothetical protein